MPSRRPRRTANVPLAYNVTVADVMSREPVTIGPESSLFDALVLMRVNDIQGIPVVGAEQEVQGVLSQKDIVRVLSTPLNLPDAKGLLDILMVSLGDQPDARLAKLRELLEETKVESAMTSPPLVVRGDAPLELAMEVMSDRDISRLPVVEGPRLVGIVTPTDLISAAFRVRSGRAPGARL